MANIPDPTPDHTEATAMPNTPDVPNVPTDETPDFATLAPNPMGAMALREIYLAHLNYCDLFAATYPESGPTPRFKAWRDSLTATDRVDVPDGTPNVVLTALTVRELDTIARVSPDASSVVTVWRYANALMDTARQNLEGIHASMRHAKPIAPGEANAQNVEAARFKLDTLIKMSDQLVSSNYVTADAVQAVVPFRFTDKGRRIYDGPTLPTSRKTSVIRSNTKRLVILIDGTEQGDRESTLEANAKAVLRLSMSELRETVGAFTAENYGQDFTAPNGVTFQLVERADAPAEDETEDETSE